MSQRVAQIVRSHGAVSETFIRDAISELARLGWSSWVIAQVVDPNAPATPGVEGVSIVDPPPQRPGLSDILRLRTRAERRTAGFEQVLKEVKPDVVHAHFGWNAADVRLAARRLDLPLVVTFRGSDVSKHPGFTRARVDYPRVFREAARIIAISEFVKGRLRALGCDRPIEVIPSGTRLEEFPFHEPPTSFDGPRLLFVGRLEPVKGLDVLLRALPLVRENHPGVTLDVIGDGATAHEYRALATDLDLDDVVRWCGEGRREAVLRALSEAELFVLPNVTRPNGQAEGLGNIGKEAQAVGIPVVATKSGGIPETIPPSHRHRLVPSGDHIALATAIAARLDDSSNWPAQAVEARRFVEETFDWRRLGARVAEVYAAAVSHGRD